MGTDGRENTLEGEAGRELPSDVGWSGEVQRVDQARMNRKDLQRRSSNHGLLGRCKMFQWRPWNDCLRFPDSKYEKEFLSTWEQDFLLPADRKVATAIVMLGMSIWVILMVKYQTSFNPLHSLILLSVFAIRFLAQQQPSLYKRFRMVFVAWMRITMPISVSYFWYVGTNRGTLPPPDPVIGTFLLQIMLRSGSVAAIIVAIGFRAQFRIHLWIQMITVVVCMLIWVPQSCSICSASSSVFSVIQSLGWTTEWTLVKVATFGQQFNLGKGIYPCWLVVGFIHVLAAFFVPSLFVCYWEYNARAAFLVHSTHEQQNSKMLTSASLKWMPQACVLLVVVEVAWFSLRLVQGITSFIFDC